MVLVLSMLSVVSAEQEKEWIAVTTSVDASGNEVTTQIYGYYLNTEKVDQVFVVCDPNTGEETGDAYVPGFEVGKRDIIIGYNIKYGEDFNAVKKINPVTIKMVAPNVFTDIGSSDYGISQYRQTGEFIQSTSSSATWPGSTKAYLIPGSDPDYWLVVNEVHNPNGWPVKVNVQSNIRSFRSSFYRSGRDIIHETEVYLDAFETKHILVNRGKPADCYFLADDIENIAWTEARLDTYVTENLDTELPERLKDNKGYVKFVYTAGSLQPTVVDLSKGIDISHSLTCISTKNDWYFTGEVRYSGNGWVALPHPGSTENSKANIENILNSNCSTGTISENESFRIIQSNNIGASLDTGPRTQILRIAGPSIMDYSGKDKGLFELNDKDKPMFSGDGIPALFYTPIFVEFYRFAPNENSTNVGRLVKEIKPGFVVAASTIKRPYISVDDELRDYSIKREANYWKITLNHHVVLTAVNPDSYGVIFTDASLALSNIGNAVYKIERYLEERYDTNIHVESPKYYDRKYNPALVSFDTISLAPKESNVIYDQDVTTEILLKHIADSERENIEKAVESVISYFNWMGEAAFCEGQIKFNEGNTAEQILTLNRSRFELHKGEYPVEVGFPYRKDELLQPLSYFKNGVPMRATDELWILLLNNKQLSGMLLNTDGDFWPSCRYSSDSGWVFKKSFKERR